MRTFSSIVTAAVLAAGAPALAVGLGPLSKEGVTYSPDKAFFLTLINPYSRAREYQSVAYTLDERPIGRVDIRPALTVLGAKSQRRLVVIVRDLEPGEEVKFKVCSALAKRPERTIHARVCSNLTARRLALRRQ